MVARAEAAEAVKSANVDIAGGVLTDLRICKALQKARQLGPSQRQLVLIELAMRLWLEPLAWRGSYYHAFETFLWSYFAGKNDLGECIAKLTDYDRFGADAVRLYCEFLRKMFAASGKTRDEFYCDMLADAGIAVDFHNVEFGAAAEEFHAKAMASVHREHLLVFYSTGLLSKTLLDGYRKDGTALEEEELEVLYGYFEENFPLGSKFLNYAGDASLFKAGIKSGTLSKL